MQLLSPIAATVRADSSSATFNRHNTKAGSDPVVTRTTSGRAAQGSGGWNRPQRMHDQVIGTARPECEGSDAGYLPEVMSWGCDTHTEGPHNTQTGINDASYTLLSVVYQTCGQ